jgi:exonuclease VII large subunit
MKFNLYSSGYGHSIESVSLKRFAPQITFQEDDGAGGNTQVTPPELPTEDVSGLKSALQKERDRAKDLEKQFASLKDSFKGIDPEKYQQFEALQQEAEKFNQREAQLKQTLETEFTAQIQKEQVKAQEWEKKFTSLQKRTQVEKYFAATNGRMEAGEDGVSFFDSINAHADRHLRINEKGELEVLDANGVRRFSKKDASKPMSAIEFMEELSEHPVLGHCFAPKNNAKGGGMQQSAKQFGANQDLSSLPFAERVRAIRARG